MASSSDKLEIKLSYGARHALEKLEKAIDRLAHIKEKELAEAREARKIEQKANDKMREFYQGVMEDGQPTTEDEEEDDHG